MEDLQDSTKDTFRDLSTETDVFDAVATALHTTLNPDISAVLSEVDGELTVEVHRGSGDGVANADFSLTSLPFMCQRRKEACKIDDTADVRSTSVATEQGDTGLSDYRSLLLIPFGSSSVVLLGSRQAGAFTEADFHLARTITSLATACLETRRSEGSMDAQDEWIEQIAAVLSHDVGNILTSLAGNLELAREDIGAETYERLDQSVDRLEQLIDDAVDALRSGRAELEIEVVDLEASVKEAWELAGDEDAQLVIGDLGQTHADESKLRQVFENLFANAVTHGDSDGMVWVGRFEDGLFVEDSGPGIPPDERDRVFEPGYTSTDGNTGFGLPIVSWIVNAHGWEISMTESDFGGARFEISDVPYVLAE